MAVLKVGFTREDIQRFDDLLVCYNRVTGEDLSERDLDREVIKEGIAIWLGYFSYDTERPKSSRDVSRSRLEYSRQTTIDKYTWIDLRDIHRRMELLMHTQIPLRIVYRGVMLVGLESMLNRYKDLLIDRRGVDAGI